MLSATFCLLDSPFSVRYNRQCASLELSDPRKSSMSMTIIVEDDRAARALVDSIMMAVCGDDIIHTPAEVREAEAVGALGTGPLRFSD